jgi:peptidoglycan/LPS O-acetylase OafA/YrhL
VEPAAHLRVSWNQTETCRPFCRSGIEFINSRIARLYPSFWIAVLLSALALTLLADDPPSLANIAALDRTAQHVLGRLGLRQEQRAPALR